MRLASLLLVPFLMGLSPASEAPATTNSPQALQFDMPGYQRPAPVADGDLADMVERARCTDTVELVREANRQPSLQRGDDAAPEPLMYKAVDQDIDGCDVLVMADDRGDLRPVPDSGPVVLRPADAD